MLGACTGCELDATGIDEYTVFRTSASGAFLALLLAAFKGGAEVGDALPPIDG